MFKNIKRLSSSVQELTEGLTQLILILSERPQDATMDTDSLARLDALEVRQSVWEAEMDAQLIKADSKYKSARNAEERSRTMAKRNEETGEGSEDGVAEIQAALEQIHLQNSHVEGSEENGVQHVRPNMGLGPKETALRAKFG
jgi:multidrug resistance efflux pump